MFRNLIKISIRNFKRQLFFSLLNILGLTLGMASFILIYMWIVDEISYEKAYSKAAQIHLVHKECQVAGQPQFNQSTPAPLAPRLKNDFAEIKLATRIARMNSTIKYEDLTFTNQNLCAADVDYLSMFDLEFISGNPQTALTDLHSVIIAEKIVERFFNRKSNR